ncbi:class I SAM-dependent DNA methyltransferase [Ornithinimicrobium sp. Y1694]|uniref:class I SAM-dependent DNA methyltransferase n=1 Tax=Ornithinimicrobium sp. Y1694 TaxID=3418590 RepID=UPI003CF7D347
MAAHDHHFDSTSATWDEDPGKVRSAGQVAADIARRVPEATGGRLLEYGAGTGLVTQALVGYLAPVAPIVLVDSSSGMRKVIEEKIVAGSLPEGSQVWDLDLSDAATPLPDERFDLVVASMVLHHVPDLATALGNLTELLLPGGHLAIADLDAEDGSFHAHLHDFDGHHGFVREDVATALREAGLDQVVIEDCHAIERDDQPYTVFLATARRP